MSYTLFISLIPTTNDLIITIGKLLNRISTKNRFIFDVHHSGSTLAVPVYSSNGQVKLYQLK